MSDRSPRRAAQHVFMVLAVLALVLGVSRRALAEDHAFSCDGPPQCCPSNIDFNTTAQHVVEVGVVLEGIHEITEKSSSWNADLYLYEQWVPAPNFVPQTEIVNEIERKSVDFDETELRDGSCLRTRRIRSTLRTHLNLRTFPFDIQTLTLQLSDAEFPSRQVRYADHAIAGLDAPVAEQLIAWKILSPLAYVRTSRSFRWDPGSPDYDYGTFALRVRRHVSYHLSKYFLPLLLIVVVSFSVFWIDREDLASKLQIGVTCLLAVIALQFTEASDLPDVSYLTIADRAYAASCVAIALAVLHSVYMHRLAKNAQGERALLVERWSRIAFPIVLILALVGGALRAFSQARHEGEVHAGNEPHTS